MRYLNLLETALEPFIEEMFTGDVWFQQDGASCHTTTHKNDYFTDIGLAVLDWSTNLLEMNCIENVWGDLVPAVYRDGMQYETVSDLKEAITYEWVNMSFEAIRKHIKSIPRQVCMLDRVRGDTRSIRICVVRLR